MPVRYDGKDWHFDTPAEAAEFHQSLTVPPAQTKAPPTPVERPRRRGRPTRQATANQVKASNVKRQQVFISHHHTDLSKGSRQILEAIMKLPESGLQSEEFARAIGSPSPASVPVRMMVLSKELKVKGMTTADVVKRDKIYVKGRARSVYKRGPRLEDALRVNGELFAGR